MLKAEGSWGEGARTGSWRHLRADGSLYAQAEWEAGTRVSFTLHE